MLSYYLIKRTFCFFDEWLTYGLLVYLYSNTDTLGYFPFLSACFIGTTSIITSYKNLSYLERKMGFDETLWFPIQNN